MLEADRSLEVWRHSRTGDGVGGTTSTLAKVGDVEAKVDQPTALERMVAAQSGAELTHSIYLDPNDPIQVKRLDELRHGTWTWRVESVVIASEVDYVKAGAVLIQPEGTGPL